MLNVTALHAHNERHSLPQQLIRLSELYTGEFVVFRVHQVICTYISIYMYVCMYIRMCISISICIYVHIDFSTYIHVDICVYISICMYLRMEIHMCKLIQMCNYVHIYNKQNDLAQQLICLSELYICAYVLVCI